MLAITELTTLSGTMVWVCILQIAYMEVFTNPNATKITFVGGDSIHVTETPREIIARLQPPRQSNLAVPVGARLVQP